MKEPTAEGSSYCDMAENVKPGLDDGLCTEIDVLEANNWAMQTAIHTKLGTRAPQLTRFLCGVIELRGCAFSCDFSCMHVGGTFGSGDCDRNGCFMRLGPTALPELTVRSRDPCVGLSPCLVRVKKNGESAPSFT